MHNIADIVILIRKKMEGTISDEESLFLSKWVAENRLHAELLERTESEESVMEDVRDWWTLRDEEEEGSWESRLAFSTLDKIRTDQIHTSKRQTPIFRKILPIAAAVLLVFSFAFAFYHVQLSEWRVQQVGDLMPGTNKALITLADGRVIELREDQEGVILGERLTYEDGTLIAQLNDKEIIYSTIETPRGGQYQITLADGTKVWLNAGTKLTYPSHFTGGTRSVELSGEAYFEVAPAGLGGERIPFLVKTAQQEVEVLGTHFNVQAYADDEDDARTTLVEGAVLLHAQGRTLLLHPGEQGTSTVKGLNKKKVGVEQYIAWKNNEFVFDETELAEALKMLSRWYDFDLKLDRNARQTHLYGSISRNKNLTEVLQIMESSGLKFRIERANDRNRLIVLQ